MTKKEELLALADRVEHSLILAMGNHYRLDYRLAREDALDEAAKYAVVLSAIRTKVELQ